MFAGEELKKLDQTKRLLVAQSDLHRNLIRMEMVAWGARFNWLRGGKFALGNNRLYVVFAAILAGLGASAVKWRTIFRWAPRVFAAWRLAKGLFRI